MSIDYTLSLSPLLWFFFMPTDRIEYRYYVVYRTQELIRSILFYLTMAIHTHTLANEIRNSCFRFDSMNEFMRYIAYLLYIYRWSFMVVRSIDPDTAGNPFRYSSLCSKCYSICTLHTHTEAQREIKRALGTKRHSNGSS